MHHGAETELRPGLLRSTPVLGVPTNVGIFAPKGMGLVEDDGMKADQNVGKKLVAQF
jgi:hypothetical protein